MNQSLEELIIWRDRVRKMNDPFVVATNGCFDIIHRGHLELLRKAKSFGDFLVVGLNSDKSVKALKGHSRPINNQNDRKLVLEAIRYVDYVYIFDETNSANFLTYSLPHIYVKSSDYTLENMSKDELAVLKSINAEIKFTNYIQGVSTSNIISRMHS